MAILRNIRHLLSLLFRNDKEDIITKIRKGGGTVGLNCDILHSSIDLSAPWLISIGNNVTITGAELLVHDASMKKKSRLYEIRFSNNWK